MADSQIVAAGGLGDDDGAGRMIRFVLGLSGKKWLFKSKANGVQRVQLIKLPLASQHRIIVRTKRWFTAAAAEDVKEDTHVTITVGTQCFTHAVTTKIP